MRTIITAATTTALLLTTAGCASGSTNRPAGHDTTRPSSGLEGNWRLTGLTKDGTKVTLSGVRDAGAGFHEMASFSDGCHGYSATYRAMGRTLRFGDVASTANACTPGPWSRVGDVLSTFGPEHPVTWQVTGDRLSLTTGRYALTYDRA